MRILLAHNKTYYPALGGGDKSNRELMEALARRGHECRVVARVTTMEASEHERFLQSLAERGTPVIASDGGVVIFEHRGVRVETVTGHPNLRAYFEQAINEFQPDVILTSTDDPAQVLLGVALRAPRKVVYLARATLALPFGPDCAFPSESKTEALRQCDGVVTVSHYVAKYMREFGQVDAVFKPIALQGEGPFPVLGSFDNPYVTMVNPCGVKGLPIFLELARRMPETRFAAVPTWGSGEEDMAAMQALPNLDVLEPADDIEVILKRTRVMMVPSLWAEARSRIVVESMLRGVPVIASNAGGLIEAKMGVDYLVPVKLIEKYKPSVNEQMVPIAEIPAQNVDPWERVLRELVTNRTHYEELSHQSREVALHYPDNFDIEPLARYLEQVIALPPKRVPGAVATKPSSILDRLSPEKRALLARRLKHSTAPQARSNDWFVMPPVEASGQLFCFPYAGGGTSTYRSWQKSLKQVAAVIPAQLPGREARTGEAPIEEIKVLVTALADAMEPLLSERSVFFGHSMGAGIAFELARELRRRGGRLPRALLVSAARAPQYRRHPVQGPEPDDEALLAQIRRLGGIPDSVLESGAVMKMLLPLLKADTRMYRAYRYEDEAPLEIPIRAYGGLADANVEERHLQDWSEQTTAGFRMRWFAGGHFYLQSSADLFLQQLEADLNEFLA